MGQPALLCLPIQVDLYEVLDSRVKPQEGDLITSRLVPVYTQGWEVFNATQIVTASNYISLYYVLLLFLHLQMFSIYDKTAGFFKYRNSFEVGCVELL